jgi:N-carbamoylputrescine amidase
MRAALIQMKASVNREENHDRAEELLKEAARRGVEVACLQEIFATWFFPQTLDPKLQDLAEPIDGPTVSRMRAVAQALGLWVVVTLLRARHAGRALQCRRPVRRPRGGASATTASTTSP